MASPSSGQPNWDLIRPAKPVKYDPIDPRLGENYSFKDNKSGVKEPVNIRTILKGLKSNTNDSKGTNFGLESTSTFSYGPKMPMRASDGQLVEGEPGSESILPEGIKDPEELARMRRRRRKGPQMGTGAYSLSHPCPEAKWPPKKALQWPRIALDVNRKEYK